MSSPPLHPPVRHKHKPAPAGLGIAAGAEDAKYQAKYKELKRKVRDIEADNDKLHFKVLQAKLNIRRMKMERAVLYERLAVVPPSPTLQDRHALPQQALQIQTQPPASSRPTSGSHHHLHPEPEHAYAAAPRPLADPATVLSPRMSVHSPRRVPSSAGHDGHHHLPSMAPMPLAHPPPQQHLQQPQQQQHPGYDTSRGHALTTATSPPLHHTSVRTRSHSSSSRSHQHQHQQQSLPPPSYRGAPPAHHYADSLPPPASAGPHPPLHSPPLSDRERPSRRSETHEYAESLGHNYDRPISGGGHIPLSPQSRAHHTSPVDARRIHAHQRMGPGTYISREDFQEGKQRERDLEREREWDRELRDHRDHRERERERDHRDPRERDRERERDWDHRDHERRGEYSAAPTSAHSSSRDLPPAGAAHHHLRSPHAAPRSAARTESYDPHAPPRSREREHGQSYYHDHAAPNNSGGGYPPPLPPAPRLSRSDTPGSASASGSGAPDAPPSRPDSRSQAYYDRERDHQHPHQQRRRSSSSYRLRPVGSGGGGPEDVEMDRDRDRDREYAHDAEHHRGYPPPPAPAGHSLDREPTPGGGGAGGGGRKRTRAEMDVDSDYEDDRRYGLVVRRSGDGHAPSNGPGREEARMGSAS